MACSRIEESDLDSLLSELSEEDESKQMCSLMQICQMIAMGNEENLSSITVRKIIVRLIEFLKSNQTNFEIINHACRILSYSLEALPSSSSSVVEAVPMLLEKLYTVNCADVAEQIIKTLDDLSVKHGRKLVDYGTIDVLNYIDFFPLHTQRRIMKIVSNCCSNVYAAQWNAVSSSLQLLSARLNPEQDSKCVEYSVECFTHLVQNVRNDDKLLNEIATDYFLLNFQMALTNESQMIFEDVFKTFSILAAISTQLAVKLLRHDIHKTIKQQLTSMNRQRSTQQILLVLSLIDKLLPEVPRQGLFAINDCLSTNGSLWSWHWQDDDGSWRPYSKKENDCINAGSGVGEEVLTVTIYGKSYTIDLVRKIQTNDESGTKRPIRNSSVSPKRSKDDESTAKRFKADLIHENDSLYSDFIRTLFPCIYLLSVTTFCRRLEEKCSELMLKMVFYASAQLLSEVVKGTGICRRLSMMLARKSLKCNIEAIQICQCLLDKAASDFKEELVREGVLFCLSSLRRTPIKHPKPNNKAKVQINEKKKKFLSTLYPSRWHKSKTPREEPVEMEIEDQDSKMNDWIAKQTNSIVTGFFYNPPQNLVLNNLCRAVEKWNLEEISDMVHKSEATPFEIEKSDLIEKLADFFCSPTTDNSLSVFLRIFNFDKLSSLVTSLNECFYRKLVIERSKSDDIRSISRQNIRIELIPSDKDTESFKGKVTAECSATARSLERFIFKNTSNHITAKPIALFERPTVEFLHDDRVLPTHLTLFDALPQDEIFLKTHQIRYRKSTDVIVKADKIPIVLYSIWTHVCKTGIVPNYLFLSSELTSSVRYALSDSEQLPSWLLKISSSFPFVLPFDLRKSLFYLMSFETKSQRSSKVKQIVDRNKILDEAKKIIIENSNSSISLDIEFQEEVGTGLGPTLEFFSLVSNDIRKMNLIWRQGQTLFPSPIAEEDEPDELFEFIGKFLGKSLADHKIIDLPFSFVFYKWLLGMENELTFEDLKYLDPDLAESCSKLKNMNPRDLQNLEVDFTLPGYENIELKPNGQNIILDSSNISEYLRLVVDWTLRKGVSKQMNILRRNLNIVFPVSNLRLFYPNELESLFCGDQYAPWSSTMLIECTKADHGYTHNSPAVQNLIEILTTFDLVQQRAFLQFVTGCPRLPFGGFKALSPPLTFVEKVVYENPDKYLPSVMTCANYLKLPNYSTIDIMREKVTVAIHEGQFSFYLS